MIGKVLMLVFASPSVFLDIKKTKIKELMLKLKIFEVLKGKNFPGCLGHYFPMVYPST